ncbi:MAG: hypothetical protein J6Y92_05895 [Lentisphaeria bacterium]|nr:hypothetical protein [Lentisphaeria bacterium]
MMRTLKEDFAWDAAATSRNLLFYPGEQLCDYAGKEQADDKERTRCVAELFVREFLKRKCAEKEINALLPDGELDEFWRKAGEDFLDVQKKSRLIRKKLWNPANPFSGSCEISIRERLRILFEETDGFIPVYQQSRAFFIPFHFEKTDAGNGGIVDLVGKPIPKWQAPYARLFPDARLRCIVHCDQEGIPPLTGNSFMLPLYLAFLRSIERTIHYNHLRLVATGEIDKNGRLTAVDTKEKAEGFQVCFYRKSCFFFPESEQYSIPQHGNEIPLRNMTLAELPETIRILIEAKGLLVPTFSYALDRLKVLAEDRNSNYGQWDVMLSRVDNNMRAFSPLRKSNRKPYLQCLMLKSSFLCHMGKTDEALALNRKAQEFADNNHFIPDYLRLRVEELVEFQDREDFAAIAAAAPALDMEIKENDELDELARTDLLMRYCGTMGQAHSFGDLAGEPGFSRWKAKDFFDEALDCAIELSEMRDKTKLTRNEINLAEGDVAQDMNYRFLWYALFEPETEDADNAYEAAKGHIESNLQPTEDNPFRGETLCEKNRQYLVRIKAFSLYRYWMRSGEVPVFDREDLLISKNEGDWLPALTGKYVGALLAASGKKSEAASLFREYFGLLDEKTDPIMRFIQMTFCCEAFRSTGDESYCKRARTLVEGLREIYRRSSTLKAWDHYLQKGDAAVFPGLDYWY